MSYFCIDLDENERFLEYKGYCFLDEDGWPIDITHVLEAVSLPGEGEIQAMGVEYAKSIDPLNITPEKQMDILMGFKEGATQIISNLK